MNHNLKNFLSRHPKLYKLYRVIYYTYYKRHIYGFTSSLRVLPDFIVIGVVRGGTTSLYENLSKHPCIYGSAYDELGFFDSNFHLGIHWYRSLFPNIFQKRISKIRRGCFMTYDVTPFYIWNPTAAKRIAVLLPNAKIIALLRNPVDRAYSNYYLGVNDGTEGLSFEDAIKDEIDLLNEESSEDSTIKYTRRRSYIAKGLYVDQLKIWLDLFPRENILILRTEDFQLDPQKTCSKIFKFLNLPDHMIKFEKVNVGKYPNMKQETREFLLKFFEPHNRRLKDLTTIDFEWDI